MQEKFEQKQGWENQTNLRKESIKIFLKEYFERKFKTEEENKKDYSSDLLEFSGGGPAIIEKVQKGVVDPQEVTVLYKNNQIIQIHTVFTAEQGHNLDVYFKGEALKDYLESC